MKVVKFTDPLYYAEITYLIGGSPQDMIKYLKRVHKKDYKCYSWDKEFVWEDDFDTTDGYQFHISAPLGKGEVFYVWVARPSAHLLFHETFHLVGDILQNRGVAYTFESEEAYAYLGGWIFDKIYTKLKKSIVAD